MPTLHWHIPNYLYVDPPPRVEYASATELLDLPRIRGLSARKDFDHWETSPHGDEWLLVWAGRGDIKGVVAYLSEWPGDLAVDPSWSIPRV